MGKNEKDEEKKSREALLLERKKVIYNLVLLLAASFVVLIGVLTMAWFASNNTVNGTTMSVTVQGADFEIRTSGSEGIYDSYILDVDSDYIRAVSTSETAQKIVWQLTSTSNMENLWDGDNPISAAELRRIQRIESESYGLSPGDHGQLTFTVVPKSGSEISVSIQPVLSCYKTSYDDEGYQNTGIEPMTVTVDAEREAINLLSGHILLFRKYDSDDDKIEEMHLITQPFTLDDISSDTDVTLYWVWPKRLNNILELSVDGLDNVGCLELREYFFKRPEIFLAKYHSDGSDVFDGITLINPTEQQIAEMVTAMTTASATYNGWSARYNNADQIIGDRVGYVMLEVLVNKEN